VMQQCLTVLASVCQTGSALSWLCAPICVFAQSGRPAASRRQFWVSLETRGRQAQSVVGTAVVEATGDLDAGQVAHMQAGIGLTEAAARAGFPSVGYVAGGGLNAQLSAGGLGGLAAGLPAPGVPAPGAPAPGAAGSGAVPPEGKPPKPPRQTQAKRKRVDVMAEGMDSRAATMDATSLNTVKEEWLRALLADIGSCSTLVAQLNTEEFAQQLVSQLGAKKQALEEARQAWQAMVTPQPAEVARLTASHRELVLSTKRLQTKGHALLREPSKKGQKKGKNKKESQAEEAANGGA